MSDDELKHREPALKDVSIELVAEVGDSSTFDSTLLDAASDVRFDSPQIAADHPISLSVDSVIDGKFQIEGRLGQGGMSTVYKAKHLLLNRSYALKILSNDNSSPKAILRFQQEAKAASLLSHPNIASVREFGHDQYGRPYIAMDFVDGSSLAEVLRNEKTLEHGRASDLIKQICRGLEHAHANKIVHRDVKPANIIVCRDSDGNETVKIVDFGIAKIFEPDVSISDGITKTGDVFGTPYYMSPEQCLGQPADERSDIYSLGCLLYEIIYGKPPFVGASAFETLDKQIHDKPVFPTAVVPLNVIIMRALEKAPDDRYRTIEEMLSDLEKIERGEKIATNVPSQDRMRFALILGSIVSLSVLSALIYLGFTKQDETQRIAIWATAILYIGAMVNIVVSSRLKRK